MLSAAVWLLCNSLFFSLRLAGNPGSFPRPLSAAEEKEYLERRERGGRFPAHRAQPASCGAHREKDVFQNANLSREKVTEAVCPSLK